MHNINAYCFIINKCDYYYIDPCKGFKGKPLIFVENLSIGLQRFYYVLLAIQTIKVVIRILILKPCIM